MAIDKVGILDASWLHMETKDMPFHVSSVPIFKLPRGKKETFFEELKEHVASRAHLLKNYRVKKKNTPLNLDHPVWVEADEIDIDYHVRRHQLPKPGTMTQLEAAVAEIQELPLDLERPLWQYTLIEGLKGNRVGLLIKIHHSVIDGESGAAQLDVMFDTTRKPRPIENPGLVAQSKEPSNIALLAHAYARFMMQPIELIMKLPSFASAAGKVARIALDKNRVAKIAKAGPKTRFNRAISDKRSFAMASVPLADIKAIKKAAGVTLNDVVMAMCGDALRRFLDRTGDLPEETLTSAIPVSLRRGDQSGSDEMGTLVTSMICPLGTHISDPTERLQFVNQGSIEAKATVEAAKGAMIQQFNALGAPLAMRLASQAYGALRLADMHRPLANLIISNVAGPRHTIYLNGAEMLHYHPVSAVAHGQGLNITVQSYCDSLDFGFIGCKNLMPDLALLRDDLIAAFQTLKAIYVTSEELEEISGEMSSLPVHLNGTGRTNEKRAKMS